MYGNNDNANYILLIEIKNLYTDVLSLGYLNL